jgi:hypothetical protein
MDHRECECDLVKKWRIQVGGVISPLRCYSLKKVIASRAIMESITEGSNS